MIKRIRLEVMLTGVEGWIPPGGLAPLLSGLFEYQGFDYYVRHTGKFGVWDVIKVASDGGPLAEYRVQRDRKTMTCDCQAGRKHLACRHKEMVEMFESNRVEGSCGTQPKAPPPREPPKTVVPVSRAMLRSSRDLLADVAALMERANASR